MSTIQAGATSVKAGQQATVTTTNGVTISGEVRANNSFARILEFADDVKLAYRTIKKAEIEGDPRWDKPGVYVYYSLGLERDGHMTRFPNLLLKTLDNGWYRIGNAGGMMTKIEGDEVPFESMLPLTIHPDYVGGNK